MISKEILTTLIQIQTDDGDQITSNIGPLGPRSTQYKTSNTVDDVCFFDVWFKVNLLGAIDQSISHFYHDRRCYKRTDISILFFCLRKCVKLLDDELVMSQFHLPLLVGFGSHCTCIP